MKKKVIPIPIPTPPPAHRATRTRPHPTLPAPTPILLTPLTPTPAHPEIPPVIPVSEIEREEEGEQEQDVVEVQETPHRSINNTTVMRDISGRSEVQRLKASLMNGQLHAATLFSAHTQLRQRLQWAYEQELEEQWFAAMENYIRLAQGRVAGMITQQEYKERILPVLLNMVNEYGLAPVARYLL